MKISKTITGLVVCGALMFTGALSSSAQEIDPPKTLSVNYSSSETFTMDHEFYLQDFRGPSFTTSVTMNPGPPRLPIVYSGTVFYVKSESYPGKYLYRGKLTRVVN
ncbi:hypothetical protein [Lysinibacillus agricola]|uniref:hypothetical protein n=1 Tax=Lysinibacillus agricola TaxID=2590012 RepID=UPI003C1321CC